MEECEGSEKTVSDDLNKKCSSKIEPYKNLNWGMGSKNNRGGTGVGLRRGRAYYDGARGVPLPPR